jgi:hypothetical protein
MQNGCPMLNDRSSTLISASNKRAYTTGPAAVHMKSGPRRKMFNLKIYKYHVFGDYPDAICHLSTTDSFSTEPVRNHRL